MLRILQQTLEKGACSSERAAFRARFTPETTPFSEFARDDARFETEQPGGGQESVSSSEASNSESSSEEEDAQQLMEGQEQPESSETEPLPEDRQDSLPSEPTVGASGLDPPSDLIPNGASFSVVLDSGISRYLRTARANSATNFVTTDNSITYKYPFSGGNSTYPAYIFTTSTGEAAYCIEPARWNSINNDPVTGDLTYNGLSYSKQVEVAKAIACNPSGAGNHNYYMACQVIIWQVVYGQSFGFGSVYNAVIADNSSKLSGPYHGIISKMESGGEIPSFMSPDKSNPTQHTIEESGGSYSIKIWRTPIPKWP